MKIFLFFLLFLVSCQSLPPNSWDILIYNANIVTMNDKGEILENACVAISGDKISLIDSGEKCLHHSAKERIDVKGNYLLPGLINLHTHASMSVFKGFKDDTPEAMVRVLMPVERVHLNRDMVYWGALYSMMEMIKTGTTTFVDMYYAEDVVAQAVEKAGMRAILGETFTEVTKPSFLESVRPSETLLSMVSTYQNHPTITPGLAVTTVHMLSESEKKEIREFSKKYDVPLLFHASEKKSQDGDKGSDIGLIKSLGLLKEKTLIAHATHVSVEDLRMISENGAGVAINLLSNLKQAMGVPDLRQIVGSGAHFGWGTDSSASGNSLNLFEQMKTAAILSKMLASDEAFLPAKRVLSLATAEASGAIHKKDSLGSIEVNKLADLIVINKEKSFMMPEYDPYSSLVYSNSRPEIELVIINGKVILREGKFTTIDEKEVHAEMKRINQALKKHR